MQKSKRSDSKSKAVEIISKDKVEKSEKLAKTSKTIQKSTKPAGKPQKVKQNKGEEKKDGANPKLKKETKAQSKIFKKIDNFSEFVQAETSKYQKIRKQTIAKIQIDTQQVKKAVKALLAHFESSKPQNNLLDSGDDFIYLEIVMGKVPDEYSIRPIQIALPHPIYSAEDQSKFAVISTDPARAYKDKIQELNLPCIAKVLGYTKLKKNFPTYTDKRKLAYEYDLFFCDYKLYNILRKPLGKTFYERKKFPFPIDCENVPEFKSEQCADYEAYLNDLTNYTYFMMGNGPAYTVKVARVNMDAKAIAKNVIHGVYNTIPHIIKDSLVKHNNVRQISIKTAQSISLPIFNQLTEEEVHAYIGGASGIPVQIIEKPHAISSTAVKSSRLGLHEPC